MGSNCQLLSAQRSKGGESVHMEVDTGSAMTLMADSKFKAIFGNVNLHFRSILETQMNSSVQDK